MFNFIKKHKRLLFILALIPLSLGIFFATRKKPETYKTTSVVKSTITSSISASGKIAAKKEAKLHFQTGGRLAWVGVKEGDSVTPWQAIASLDKREVEKNLVKALRDYSKERNDFEEDRQVTYKGEVLTNVMSDTVKRILEKNQWDLDKAVLDVEIKDIALQYANLVSPISGIVTQIDTPVAGVNVIATNLFVVSDPGSTVFEAEIDETDVGKIQVGQEVTITLDSYPDQQFSGTVAQIAFSAITTSSGGTAFKADISLPDNSNLRFKPGMNGDVEILLQKKDNILTIPVEAVFQEHGVNFVYIMEDGKPVKKQVETGIEGETEIEILEGLSENQIIIENANDYSF